MPAGNICIGHRKGSVLWCMQMVQLDHFIGVSYQTWNFICFPYAILCVMQGVNFFHFIGPGFARAGIHWNNPCGVSGSTLRLKPVGNAHRFTPKQTIGTSEAKQTRTKFGAAECQQGTHLVPTAEAIPFEVCRGSGLIFCIPQVKPRWFLLCLAMIRARGGTVSFLVVNTGFGCSRHALQQSMSPV